MFYLNLFDKPWYYASLKQMSQGVWKSTRYSYRRETKRERLFCIKHAREKILNGSKRSFKLGSMSTWKIMQIFFTQLRHLFAFDHYTIFWYFSKHWLELSGWTALHEASSVGNEAVVAELLKAGANVNSRSFVGVIPLHDAVISGHYQVMGKKLCV